MFEPVNYDGSIAVEVNLLEEEKGLCPSAHGAFTPEYFLQKESKRLKDGSAPDVGGGVFFIRASPLGFPSYRQWPEAIAPQARRQ